MNLLLDEATKVKFIDTLQRHLSDMAIKSCVTQNSNFNLPHSTI